MKGISIGAELKTHYRRIKGNRRERGITVIVSSLGLFCLLGVAGLAIDVSHLYLAGTELQNAADAAALAGASALDGTTGGVTAAVDRSLNTLNKFEFGSAAITIPRSNIKFAVNLAEFANGGRSETTAGNNPKNIRFVKVNLPPQAVGVLFASLALNTTKVDLTRSAVAGLSINGLYGDTGLNTLCNWAPLSVVQEPGGTPLSVNPECPNKTKFTPGCTYTIRASSSGSVAAGNYQALASFGDEGGQDLRTRLGRGIHRCIHPGDVVFTEPGMNTGTVRQAINARFGDYGSNTDAVDIPPDTNIKTGITYSQYRSGLAEYTQAPSIPGKQFQRVIVIPIINQSEFDGGRTSVRILDFAPFFLKYKPGNGNDGDIQAEYIGSGFPIGEAFYDPTYTGNTNGGMIRSIAVPVLYN
jgi:Flp pilus assembly protein TadG